MAISRLQHLVLASALRVIAARRITHGSTRLDVDDQCQYTPPGEASSSQSYQGMEILTDPEWVATDNTNADGKHVLFYAYGPMFDGSGQIGAWKYDEHDNFIKFWWSKSHCMGMVGKGGCSNGKGNEPGVVSVALNPSASVTWRGYTLTNKFHENTPVESMAGPMKLVHIGEKWRLQARNGCFVDHIFVCSKSEHVAVYKDSLERQCSGDCHEGLCTALEEETTTTSTTAATIATTVATSTIATTTTAETTTVATTSSATIAAATTGTSTTPETEREDTTTITPVAPAATTTPEVSTTVSTVTTTLASTTEQMTTTTTTKNGACHKAFPGVVMFAMFAWSIIVGMGLRRD